METNTIITDKLLTYLPTTLSVDGKSIAVTDICLPPLHNFPSGTIHVKTSDRLIDIDVRSCACETSAKLKEVLERHLSEYAKFELVGENELRITCEPNVNISFGAKIMKILGLYGQITGTVTTKYNLHSHVQRIYICSAIVEPTIAGEKFFPVVYFGKPDDVREYAKYNALTVSHLNIMQMHLLDMDFDPLEFDAGNMSISYSIKSLNMK